MKPASELMVEAIIKWGEGTQIMIAFEEMAELTDALCKYRRGRVDRMDVLGEIVDVSLMVEQMKLIFDHGEFEEIKNQKLLRLESLLAGKKR